VDLRDDLRLREAQQVVVALQIFGVIFEAITTKVRFVQTIGLDHGAHGTIDYQDALREKAPELVRAIKSWRGSGRCSRGQFQAVCNLIEWCTSDIETKPVSCPQ
jgi:hypothetical protein